MSESSNKRRKSTSFDQAECQAMAELFETLLGSRPVVGIAKNGPAMRVYRKFNSMKRKYQNEELAT